MKTVRDKVAAGTPSGHSQGSLLCGYIPSGASRVSLAALLLALYVLEATAAGPQAISGCVTPPNYDKTIIPRVMWQTDCEYISTGSCCVYKMYLYADRSYNFSLCESDGVGGGCDGDGDFEMFNSAGQWLWDIDGSSACDYHATTIGTAYEDWSPPSNGYYYLKIWEYGHGDMNYCLAYSEIPLYYYYVAADSHPDNTVEALFAFFNNPDRVDFWLSAACGSLNPTYDNTPVFDGQFYWVSTNYHPCEAECSSVTITASPWSGANETSTIHLDDRQHTWCCAATSERELQISTYNPDTYECEQAWVTVSVIPSGAGAVSPSSGDSYWDSGLQCYVFDSTYTPSCSYSGRARVKFHTTSRDVIYSFEQNTTITPSSGWQTVSDSFCAEGLRRNSYQIYKMYLYAGRPYNFSLCSNDGVGAYCDGNGDLEMFNSLCVSRWQIDGGGGCGGDATTVGTAYADWYPPSDGYYYLKVSEKFASPMSYRLAYISNYWPPCLVEFDDYARFAERWLDFPCDGGNDWCGGADLNHMDGVNWADLGLFVDEWLKACPFGWPLK
ncbi:MAG: hypothetical protein ACYS4W_02785 [Planctomycetota bacterium]|jgi:hypothetical protein